MLSTKAFLKEKIFTIREDDSMLEAYKLMFDHKIRHLLVVDRKGELAGMVSDRDVQRAMVVDRMDSETETIVLSNQRKVSDFMSAPVAYVTEDVRILKVIELMLERKISAVAVYNKAGELGGIVTTDDLLKCYKELLIREDEVANMPLSYFLPNMLF